MWHLILLQRACHMIMFWLTVLTLLIGFDVLFYYTQLVTPALQGNVLMVVDLQLSDGLNLSRGKGSGAFKKIGRNNLER